MLNLNLRSSSGSFRFSGHPRVGKYAAPDGNGDGTFDDPYSITAALVNGAVSPGETLWLRGGTYIYDGADRNDENLVTGWSCSLQGTSGNEITVRPYSGERVLLDGGIRSHVSTYPAYVTIRDLELFVQENIDEPTRWSDQESSHPTDLARPAGGFEFIDGNNIKLVNNIVRGVCGSAISMWGRIDGGTMYGNLIYDNGWDAPDRKHGHGTYSQNGQGHTTTRYIWNNIFADPWASTAQLYGSSAAYINYFDIRRNIHYLTSGTPSDDGRWNTGGGRMSEGIEWHQHRAYNASTQLGYGAVSPANANNVTISDFISNGGAEFYDFTYQNYDFSEMYHYKLGAWGYCESISGIGPDQNSRNTVYPSATAPSSPVVSLYTNDYDSDRAHLYILALSAEESADVTVTGFMVSGESWELRDPKDFYGTPLSSGTCSGATITIPLDKDYEIGVLVKV